MFQFTMLPFGIHGDLPEAFTEFAVLTINPSKCTIAKTETEFFGFVISNRVLKLKVNKI